MRLQIGVLWWCEIILNIYGKFHQTQTVWLIGLRLLKWELSPLSNWPATPLPFKCNLFYNAINEWNLIIWFHCQNHRWLRLNLMWKHVFLTISAPESPKMAFSQLYTFSYILGESVKLGKTPFWGFQRQKCMFLHWISLSHLCQNHSEFQMPRDFKLRWFFF